MAKRKTAEETIVEFFQTADLAKVETVFNIVKGVLRSRQPKKQTTKPTAEHTERTMA